MLGVGLVWPVMESLLNLRHLVVTNEKRGGGKKLKKGGLKKHEAALV